MGVSPALPLGKVPSGLASKQSHNTQYSMLKQPSSTKSLLDSVSSPTQTDILNDGLVPSAISNLSIKTEYGNQWHGEERRQESGDRDDSFASDADARDEAQTSECRSGGTEPPQREFPPSEVSFEKQTTKTQVTENQVENHDHSDEANAVSKSSNVSISSRCQKSSRGSKPMKQVAKKQVKKEDNSDEASHVSTSSKASRSSKDSKANRGSKIIQKVIELKKTISSSSLSKAISAGQKKQEETPEEAGELTSLAVVDIPAKMTASSSKSSLPPLAPKKSTKQKLNKKKATKKEVSVAKSATAVSKTPTANDAPPQNNDYSWTGHIVGLRLPANVDTNFDEKCKPFERRINPSEFLAKIIDDRVASPKEHEMRAPRSNEPTYVPFHATSTNGMNTLLNISLTNQNDPTINKPIKIQMIRDPNEEVPKTFQRLQLSLQKKVGSKKKQKKKQKSAYAGAKKNNEAVLWRKKPKVEIPAVQPALLQEDGAVENALAHLGGFSDAFVLANVCNPWSDLQGSGAQEEVLTTGGEIVKNRQQGSVVSTYANNRVLMEGYERVDCTDSLTINGLLHRAATMGDDLGRYALSVPIVTSNSISSATSWIPLALQSCPPTIVSVATFGSFEQSHLFERTPVVVEVGVLFATKSRVTWFADGEQVCADCPCYTPTAADVGRVLTVVIVPQRHDHDGSGREEAYQFQRRVEALPLLPNVIPLREEFLNRPQQLDDEDLTLRCCTYNILADQNASRDVDKDDDADRIYSHCKNEHIVKFRRHPLIIFEILEYRPDVIALQEVDTDVYDGLIKPTFNIKGYEGYFSQKGVNPDSGVREGCAIFWSLDIFESVRPADMKTHTFREMIRQFSCQERMHKRQWKSLSDLADLLDKHDNLKNVMFDKLGHVMQTVVLTQRKTQEKVVVGNSHLFYHPMASHIRALKMLMACRQLEIEHKENGHCPMIFCGDFNSPPNSGAMNLILDGYLDSSNHGTTWRHLRTYSWDADDGAENLYHDVDAIELQLPTSFPGLVSAYPDPPDFTHYIEAFVCTLDYILMSKNFELEKMGATPSREDVKKYIAMPNKCMPSDHVSLVCDLIWR